MVKKLTVLLLMLALSTPAFAEVYEGVTAAVSSVSVTADSAGVLTGLEVAAGQRIESGDTIARLTSEKTFASQDGSVSLIYAEEGEDVDGAVLELAPLERYLIYCTVDKAYQSPEATLIHSGERLYLRCTADGTHRALGVVTRIDGEEYQVLTLGGELYVGETVYLYRSDDFDAESRVGIGTVVSSDPETCEGNGVLTRLCVEAGDAVERGQLLYEIGGGDVVAGVSGIVTAVSAQAGDAIQEDQPLIEVVPEDQICVVIYVDESDVAALAPGQRAELIPAFESEDAPIQGTLLDIAWIYADDAYAVRILPDEAGALALDMSVTVRI